MKEFFYEKSEGKKKRTSENTLKKSRWICEKIALRIPQKPSLSTSAPNFEAVGRC